MKNVFGKKNTPLDEKEYKAIKQLLDMGIPGKTVKSLDKVNRSEGTIYDISRTKDWETYQEMRKKQYEKKKAKQEAKKKKAEEKPQPSSKTVPSERVKTIIDLLEKLSQELYEIKGVLLEIDTTLKWIKLKKRK